MPVQAEVNCVDAEKETSIPLIKEILRNTDESTRDKEPNLIRLNAFDIRLDAVKLRGSLNSSQQKFYIIPRSNNNRGNSAERKRIRPHSCIRKSTRPSYRKGLSDIRTGSDFTTEVNSSSDIFEADTNQTLRSHRQNSINSPLKH